MSSINPAGRLRTDEPQAESHPTLRRQLRRLRLDAAHPPEDQHTWRALLAAVSRAYEECDQLVYLVTRAERITTEELESSQAALTEAQQLVGLGSWSWTPGDSRMRLSSELVRLLALDGHDGPRDLENVMSQLDPRHRVHFQEALQRAASTAVDDSGEMFLKLPNGKRRCIHYRLRSRLGTDGRIVNVDGTVLDVTDRRLAEDTVKAMALRDPLTGLWNRSGFIDQIDASRRNHALNGTPFALLFIDLDGFKSVNDTLGHNAGDTLLKQVATHLKESVRSTDPVARFGGDEFLVLLNGARDAEAAVQIAEELLQAIAKPHSIDGRTVAVSASIGIATHDNGGDSTTEMLRRADAAMYAAKQAGRNACSVYSEKLDTKPSNTRLLAHDLKQAIADDALHVVYQPIVDAAAHRMVGVEALSRWNHAVTGPVRPDLFIELAERYGLIESLSASMMRRSCAQLRRMIDLGYPDVFVAINVSPHQLSGPSLARDLRQAVMQAGIRPANVRLEITEGAIMADPDRAAAILTELTNEGYRVALDDFGTGHSSLAYLQRLPVHCIKIDRSFIAGLKRDAEPSPILRAIIGMAHGLKCEALSEGVEHEWQRRQLLALGVRLMQGFHFSQPRPDGEILAMLERPQTESRRALAMSACRSG